MNKLATALLALVIATVLIGCSSGSTSAPEPANISGRYEGSFANADGTQDGTAIFDLQQTDLSTAVSGNAIFDRAGGNTCLISGPISGTFSGSRLILTIDSVNFELNVNDNASMIQGTYARSEVSDDCGRPTGAGEITLTRV